MMKKNIIWENGSTHSGDQFLVPIGFTLMVEAGVTINYKSIPVQGKVIFNGSESSPIICNAQLSGNDIDLDSQFTNFQKDLKLSGVITLQYCRFAANLLVSSGTLLVDSCLIDKVHYFKAYNTNTTINNSEFINCEGLSFNSNLVFKDNVIAATKTKKKAIHLDKNRVNEKFSLSIDIDRRSSKTIIERNLFKDLPVGIFLDKSARDTESIFSSEVLIIRNNDFHNNGLCIYWSNKHTPAYIGDNNFIGESSYHFANRPGTNKYSDKTKHDVCEIRSNYFEKGKALVYDHRSNFKVVNRFKLPLASLPQPLTEVNKLSIPTQQIIRKVKRKEVPKKLKRFSSIFLRNYGFLLLIMTFSALMTALGTYKVSTDSFYEAMFLVTHLRYQLFYAFLSFLGAVFGYKFI